MDLEYSLFEGMPRQGPGSTEATKKALAMLPNFSQFETILDVGCGTGAQTLALAGSINCRIIAVDIYQPFLDTLQKRAQQAGFHDRITTLRLDMNLLTFPNESFDLIWSEGAIYIMGFQTALQKFRAFLKSGGSIVFSEICYFTSNIPAELAAFWRSEYPAIKTLDENLNMIKQSGYRIVDHFTLSEQTWWDSYYTPLEDKVRLYENHMFSDDEIAFINTLKNEIDLFRKFGSIYGYEYFIMQPDDSIN
ncbi:class I SAM-dependent methyltransferase [candidate division KSB1 bacterium]|nr:class I SAM-dependent methyltransferase [candidate division KSB1 bacterium]